MKSLRPKPAPNRLKVLRAQYGVKQWEVAYRLGIGQPAYNALENGKSTPTPEQKATLAKLFNTTPDAIFTSDAEAVA